MIICFGLVFSCENVSESIRFPIGTKAMVYINANQWTNKVCKALGGYE